MIIVSVALHSANDGSITELARMHIAADEGTKQDTELGSYTVRTLRGRDSAALDKNVQQRIGRVELHPRLREHVWNLVTKGLVNLGYGKETP